MEKVNLIRTRRVLVRLVFAGVVLAAIYRVALRPTSVTSHKISLGPIVVEAFGTGSVESRRMIGVGFEVTGRVAELFADQGNRVEAGQELASIDDSTFRSEVALAEQEVARVESALRRLSADIERAEAVLAGAESAMRRIRPLVAQGVSSQEDLDVAEEREKVARADLARAEAAEFEGHEAIAAARRGLERSNARLDQTIVRSPFDAIIVGRDREVGEVAVPGAAVLRLAASDTVWASVWVDETYLGLLSVGHPARIVLRSDPEHELKGTTSRIGREVDRETRELLVDITFDAPLENLVFGQRVDAWIELSRKSEIMRVPTHVLVRVGGRDGVFIASGGRTEFRELKLGQRSSQFAEVTHGLSVGDTVLRPFGEDRKILKDGKRIQILENREKEASQ